MSDYINKINSLPLTVLPFLTSMKAAEYNATLCQKYGVVDEKIGMLTDLISLLFFKELKIDSIAPRLVRELGIRDVEANNLAIDIAGMRLLVVDNWLGGEASKFLATMGADKAKYEVFVEEHKKALLEEEVYFKEQASEDPPFVFEAKIKEEPVFRKFDPLTEKKDTLELFRDSLVELLQVRDLVYIENYNQVLLLILSSDKDFQRQLEQTFYQNEEPLTSRPFSMDNKPASPTVGNWIKYFISMEGTAVFDSMSITRFMTKSENVKRLDDDERKLLNKLLSIYGNIKFFPLPFGGLQPEKWEIIPTERLEQSHSLGTGNRKMLDEDLPSANNYQRGSLEWQVLEEENRRELERRKLQALAKKYPEGSLERQAVEEELRKLSL